MSNALLDFSTLPAFDRIQPADVAPAVDALLERANHELIAAQNQMLLLGRKTALERVSTFLQNLPAHDPARPGPAGHVHLPMTRAEIADYLGLTIETVSRVFTRLKTQGVIRLVALGAPGSQIDVQGQLRAGDLETVDWRTMPVSAELAEGGVHTRDDLADLAIDELTDLTGQSAEEAKALIMKAREHWFVAGQE